MAEEQVLLERGADPLLVTLRLARPHVGNSISRATAESLSSALAVLEAEPPVGVVLAAAGDRFFCTGGDLEDYRALHDRAGALGMSLRMQQLLSRLRALPSLVVCAVEGAAVGGGTELALAADVRVAGAAASFALPQSRLGVVPGWGGGHWLAEAVGRGRAVELLVSGRTLGAEEAAAIGLVDQLVPVGHAESAAGQMVAACRTSSRAAARAIKRLLAAGTEQEAAELFADLWVGEEHRAAEELWRSRRPSEERRPRGPGGAASEVDAS